MNPKQTVPLAVTLAPLIAAAPAVLIVGGIVAVATWFLLDDKKQKPESTDAEPEAEISRKPAETVAFRPIPTAIPAKPLADTPLSAPRPASAPVQPAKPVSVTVAPSQPAKPPVAAKKIITRKDLSTIFDNGARALSRTAAVSALRRLGFGKSAAYAALSPHGRFNTWLHCAPDGIIKWTDAQKS